MPVFKIEGVFIEAETEEEAIDKSNASLDRVEEIDPVDEADAVERQKRHAMRDLINKGVADQASLLGTTADGAALCLVKLADLAEKLSTATSLIEVRDAAKPLADLTAGFRTKVADGTIKLPYMAKDGEEATLIEIGNRLNGVAEIITQNSD